MFVLLVLHEAVSGLTSYFVIVPGAKVLADGKVAEGWLHRGVKGQILILTRGVSGRRESYWIGLPGEKGAGVGSCGDWTAPKFPVLAIGDVNPPCLFVITEASKATILNRSAVFGPRFVEFTADDGTRLKAVW